MTVNTSMVHVGGSFRSVGQQQVDGLVRYDGEEWSSVGGGVGGGGVFSIAVDGEFLYIGGSFHTAGNLSVGGLARWDSKQWRALGDFNGDVHGVAVLGTDVEKEKKHGLKGRHAAICATWKPCSAAEVGAPRCALAFSC